MPAVIRRDDPSKNYGWIAVVFVVLGCLWLSAPMMQRQWEDSVRQSRQDAVSEQSLNSLDAQLNPAGAPGQAVNPSMDGSGAYARNDDDADVQKTSLYQPPETTASAAAAAGASVDGGGATLADALKNLGKSGDEKAKAKGWGGETARSGFSAPKAKFGEMSGLSGASAGGGSTSANYSVGITPFGTGRSTPVEEPTLGAPGAGTVRPARGGTLGALKALGNQLARATGSAGYDQASNLSGRAFDASNLKQANDASKGARLDSLDHAPDNLKNGDPAYHDPLKEPPKIDKPKDPKDPKADRAEKEFEMQKQMEMMLMQAAIGGIVGSISGGIGTAIAGSVFGMAPSMMSSYNSGPNMPAGMYTGQNGQSFYYPGHN